MPDSRRTNAIVGAVALVALIFLGYAVGQFLGGRFKPGFEVTATFARAGQLLRSGSDVKLRGVLVGEVTDVEIDRRGRAHVTLRILPGHEIPRNVGAAIRAKTLFGEKFVDLATPPTPTRKNLAKGDEIPLNRTIPPIEVETILEKAVPVLNAVDPEKFGAALEALARAFVGNEKSLRRTTVQSEKLLTETERTLPHLERNLVHLRYFAGALRQSDASLVEALGGLEKVGEVIRSHPAELRQTLDNLTPLARDLGDVFTKRERDLADLAGKGRPVLQSIADRADKLPRLVGLLDSFLGVWISDLMLGPYWRIAVTQPPAFGEPYAPGEEPKPRESAMRTLVGKAKGPLPDLTSILLAPVPTDEIERAARGDKRPSVRTDLVGASL